ncbi:MAG: ATP-dependent Clp protease ATP-binding subunit ClpA [Thermodesulfobacteriota bacterium]|nr:ATP-dependent Clp protease ATP-binding subunit ClpA [Thermodesulfobacteriota bacterium]
MISKELEITLKSAVQEARSRKHEFLCLEHVLFAILNDKRGREIIENCGGNIDELKGRLEEFFKVKLEKISEEIDLEPKQTLAVQRVLQRALLHIQSAEKKEMDAGDILAAIFYEENSSAVYFLESQGITRIDVLNYISHGIARTLDGKEEQVSQKEKAKPAFDPLKAFTQNLILKASSGKIDPLIGRKGEIERTIQILCRRKKNNPIFIGDPGVGKTAIVEGLALKISKKEVPEIMQNSEIFTLDLGALLAGTKFRGEFESRLKGVISALRKKNQAILFIDEIHTIVGAGATSGGSMDASNILKPVLISGDLRCIGSSTYEEYKNYFEKDRALSRRFQKIEISETTTHETFQILKGLKSYYEEHHGIKYTISALKAAAELSARYINDRYLPDKAIDVIDEAGAFLKLKKVMKAKKLITPLDIEKVVANIAKIPTRSVSVSNKLQLKMLEESLKEKVFGQDKAIKMLATAIKRSRAGLATPDKPIGSYLFIGPTGVGKTEVAKQTASILGVKFIRFDMSEYMEKHAVARLIGAPPGYIGFDQGGLLTEEVRKHPYSLVLMDEIEKAHTDIFSILLQIMDYATLTDNNGKKSDFRNVILIMTSNAGSREMSAYSIGFGIEDEKGPAGKGEKAIEKIFSPEFRNRLDAIVPFNTLSTVIMEQVVDKFIKELTSQLEEKKVLISISEEARTWLAKKGYDVIYGARPLVRLIQTEIKDRLSEEILFGQIAKGGRVFIYLEEDTLKFQFS